jgi:hypothetical protein
VLDAAYDLPEDSVFEAPAAATDKPSTMLPEASMVELVAEFVLLAGKTALAKLIAGKQPSRSDLASVSTQVADILLAHTSAHESALARVEQRLAEQPLREYNKHLAAGHRHLRDLPREWRSPEDKRDIIRDARREFVSAAAVAHEARDPVGFANSSAALASVGLARFGSLAVVRGRAVCSGRSSISLSGTCSRTVAAAADQTWAPGLDEARGRRFRERRRRGARARPPLPRARAPRPRLSGGSLRPRCPPKPPSGRPKAGSVLAKS